MQRTVQSKWSLPRCLKSIFCNSCLLLSDPAVVVDEFEFQKCRSTFCKKNLTKNISNSFQWLMYQSVRQVRQIRIAEFINKIVATRRFEKGRNAKNEFTADPASKLVLWVVFRAGPLLDQIDWMTVITIFLLAIRYQAWAKLHQPRYLKHSDIFFKYVEWMLVKYFSCYFISGLTLTPPAKTDSHLLLWWSWTLRGGRKWPFHLICLSSQQFVKFNWNALVREKVLNKRWKQFCHQGARCAPRLSDVRRPSTPWPPPRWLHQVGPRVLDIIIIYHICTRFLFYKDVDFFIPKGWMDRFVSSGKSLDCNESLGEPRQRPWAHSHSWGGQSFQRSVFFLL